MYYQYTGQPGHGKTVLAIEFALEMKAKADKLHAEDPAKHPLRELYVCNVRDFNYCAGLVLGSMGVDVSYVFHNVYYNDILDRKDVLCIPTRDGHSHSLKNTGEEDLVFIALILYS